MTEIMLITVSATILAAIGMLCWAGLAAWRGWLDLKRAQLPGPAAAESLEDQPGALIELASVRERLRRLEAIANGVEL